MIANGVQETTTTTGTGALALALSTGYVRFSEAFSVGSSAGYAVRNGNNWEWGSGTVGAGDTLERTTVHSTLVGGVYTSGGTTPISLVGASTVFCTLTAEAILDLQSSTSETVTLAGSVTAGRFISFANVQAVAGEKVLGVAMTTGVVSDAIDVTILGKSTVTSGGVFSVGSALMSDANGKAVLYTGSGIKAGTALEASTGADQSVLMACSLSASASDVTAQTNPLTGGFAFLVSSKSILEPVFSANNSNAVGDGSADDGAVLQALFNTAGAASVALEPGKTYKVRNLKLTDGQHLLLNGATLVFGGAHGTAPVSENVHTVVYVEGTAGEHVKNVAICGPGTIKGSRSGDDYTSTGTGEQDSISAQYVDGFVVTGVTFEDTKQDCISLDNATGVYIVGNVFERSGDVAVDIRTGSEITIHGNKANLVRSLVSCKPNITDITVSDNNAKTFGIGITAHGSRWRIVGNSLQAVVTPDAQDGNSASGIEVYETSGAQVGSNWSGMVIAHNTIDGRTAANGIYLRTSPNSAGSAINVTGNIIKNAVRGVLVEAGSAINITDNIIDSGASGGIILNGGTKITVSSNSIDAAGAEGIKSAIAGCMITCNRIAASGTHGVYLTSAATDAEIGANRISSAAIGIVTFAARASIVSNAVNSNAGAGVSLQGVDANTTGNKITAVGGEGVLVSQAGAVVSGNRVTSGTQGVRVSASNVVVSGNRISGAQFWGVNVSAGAVDTLVIANNLAGNTSGAIFDLGTTTDAANNKP